MEGGREGEREKSKSSQIICIEDHLGYTIQSYGLGSKGQGSRSRIKKVRNSVFAASDVSSTVLCVSI